MDDKIRLVITERKKDEVKTIVKTNINATYIKKDTHIHPVIRNQPKRISMLFL
jgi:long-subunit acyl-CoA synthetase (AMP-forming)